MDKARISVQHALECICSISRHSSSCFRSCSQGSFLCCCSGPVIPRWKCREQYETWGRCMCELQYPHGPTVCTYFLSDHRVQLPCGFWQSGSLNQPNPNTNPVSSGFGYYQGCLFIGLCRNRCQHSREFSTYCRCSQSGFVVVVLVCWTVF